ncbi:MAG: 7-cyano-7-deazaguanine synthase QueC [Planctomycetota bacterium]|jgi:7-cyano-7-deazaguanine synthase
MTTQRDPKAVVLLSGGVDSATTLAIARSEGNACHCLTVDYGQRHRRELASAQAVARALGAEEHRVVSIDLRAIGGSALTDDIEVPKDRPAGEMAASIPVTYVPARNTVFLALALGWAEVIDAAEIYIGVTAVDYSGYPDCRPEFIEAFERVANVATRMGVEGRRIHVRTPLVSLSKGEIVRRGSELGVDFSLTFSCYDPGPDERPCGRCDACLLRAEGFRAAGLPDPAAR